MDKHQNIYICSLVNIKRQSVYSLRSNSELLLAPLATKTKKTLGDRSFTVAAPVLWNKLPSYVRAEKDFKRFKTLLKTYLFREAYDC